MVWRQFYPIGNSSRCEMSRSRLSGALSQEGIISGAIVLGQFSQVGIVRGAIVWGLIILGGNCPGDYPGDNCPRWQLPGRQLSRGEFSCSHFSDDLKIADIPLIYKKNNRNDQANYRLASILLVIFEKCCYDQLFKNVNSILSTYETGYRKSCSSQHCNV